MLYHRQELYRARERRSSQSVMADHTAPSLTTLTGSDYYSNSTTRHSAPRSRDCSASASDDCVPRQMGKFSIAECCDETTSRHHNGILKQAQELVIVKGTVLPPQGNTTSNSASISPSSPFRRQTKSNYSVTSSISNRDAQFRSHENEPDYHVVKLAADCLHAQDYARMITVLANQHNTIAVLFGQALAYYKLRKFPEATQSLNRLDELASTEPSESSNRYLAHYYLGEIHIAHGRYREAARHYHKASMAHTTDTVARRYRIVQPSRAAIFSKRGSALRHSQQIMEAVRVYREALGEAESKKDRLAIYTSLGNLYQSLGENNTALAQYEHTVTLAEELHDYVSQGWAYGNMGNAYLGLNQKDKALKSLEKSLELTIKHEPSPQAIGRAYNNLGTAYQSLSELKRAEEYYDLALSQAIYGMDIGGQARVYGNYGNLLMIQKKYEQAIVHYSESLGITTDRSTRSTAHHNRGCAYYDKAETQTRKLIGANTGDQFYITYDGPSVDNQLHALSLEESLKKDYMNGRNDLTEVVAYHEETFQTIKGSSQGLSLSVSLFETNSRTFHRLQDCLVNLGEWTGALECAEQSRARTLGELMLQRKEGQLEMELSSPLKIDQVERIIQSVDTTVVYLSYTGARLLAWIFTPCHGKIVINRFQVALEDDQFDGKSLDYFLRYTLSEKLIDDSVEMYSSSSYDESPPLTMLFQAFGKPLLTILDQLHDNRAVRDVIVIPDSYTNFTPLVALLNTASGKFLGDRLCFRIMPSLLTLGILSQLTQVVVRVPEESQDFCIVGNPTIPTFRYQGDTWNLGKLPFATQEAEGVAHILKSSATLHEQATKLLVQSMISGAKVIHLATHGSASAGFLAFAGLGSSRSQAVSDEKLVLLYPEEVEKMDISPALVVLSSCDSGRGAVKADGIQGMARAFILAGAQAVLTTLWRVPDESAAVFMQFFYQYMMDGFKGSHALRKAILSIRSFQKYSRYIHWSGFQLTGRDIQFVVAEDSAGEEMWRKMGPQTVFPRLEQVKALEKALLKNPSLPTDAQIIFGVHGLKPSEVVVELVNHHHQHFTGGVFFISAENKHFMMAAEQRIQKELSDTSDKPTLVILDNLESLPPVTSSLHTLLNRSSTHIIILLYKPSALQTLRKQIDSKLMRGVNVMELKPLSELHSTQRLVYSVLSRCNFTPYNKEQRMLADIAEKTMGSPDLVELTAALLSKYIEEEEEQEEEEGEEGGEGRFLEKFYNQMTSSEEEDFAVHLVKDFDLSRSDFFLLSTLSLFGAVPIPRCLVEEIQLLAVSASPHLPSKHSPLAYLTSNHLLKVYPSTLLSSPTSHLTTRHSHRHLHTPALTESDFYYVPEIICDAMRCCMDDRDLLFSFAAARRSLDRFYSGHLKDVLDKGLAPFMAGLALVLANTMASHVQGDISSGSHGMDECYKATYKTYLLYSIQPSC